MKIVKSLYLFLMHRAKVAGPTLDLLMPEKSTVPRASPSWIAVGQEKGIGQLFQIGVCGESDLQHLLNG